jgi:hypothetical protein
VVFMVCDVTFVVNVLSNKKFRIECHKLYKRDENVFVYGVSPVTT